MNPNALVLEEEDIGPILNSSQDPVAGISLCQPFQSDISPPPPAPAAASTLEPSFMHGFVDFSHLNHEMYPVDIQRALNQLLHEKQEQRQVMVPPPSSSVPSSSSPSWMGIQPQGVSGGNATTASVPGTTASAIPQDFILHPWLNISGTSQFIQQQPILYADHAKDMPPAQSPLPVSSNTNKRKQNHHHQQVLSSAVMTSSFQPTTSGGKHSKNYTTARTKKMKPTASYSASITPPGILMGTTSYGVGSNTMITVPTTSMKSYSSSNPPCATNHPPVIQYSSSTSTPGSLLSYPTPPVPPASSVVSISNGTNTSTAIDSTTTAAATTTTTTPSQAIWNLHPTTTTTPAAAARIQPQSTIPMNNGNTMSNHYHPTYTQPSMDGSSVTSSITSSAAIGQQGPPMNHVTHKNPKNPSLLLSSTSLHTPSWVGSTSRMGGDGPTTSSTCGGDGSSSHNSNSSTFSAAVAAAGSGHKTSSITTNTSGHSSSSTTTGLVLPTSVSSSSSYGVNYNHHHHTSFGGNHGLSKQPQHHTQNTYPTPNPTRVDFFMDHNHKDRHHYHHYGEEGSSGGGGGGDGFITNAAIDVSTLTPAQRRRYERNLREQGRSQRISQQIKELMHVLTDAQVPFKTNKFSVLTSAVDYIRQLQTRTHTLDEEQKRLIVTMKETLEMEHYQKKKEQRKMAMMDKYSEDGDNENDNERQEQHGNELKETRIKKKKKKMKLILPHDSMPMNHQEIFHQCPVALSVAALDGRVLTWNHEFQKILGYNEEELSQTSIFHWLDRSDVQGLFHALGIMLKKEEEEEEEEVEENEKQQQEEEERAKKGEREMTCTTTDSQEGQDQVKEEDNEEDLNPRNDPCYYWSGWIKSKDSTKNIRMNITLARTAKGGPKFINCAATIG